MLYSFFWVTPRPLNFIFRRFGTLCPIFIGGVRKLTTPIKMEQTDSSETSAYTIQTPGNYPKERIQRVQNGFNLDTNSHVPQNHWKLLIYRVSIKSHPNYKHLLQENYVEYKHIFFSKCNSNQEVFLQHISTLQHVLLLHST